MRERKAALLRPLVQRMHVGHCWVKTPNGPRRIAEAFTEVKLSEHVMGKGYGLCPIVPGTSVTQVACLDLDSHKGDTPWDEMRRTAELIAEALRSDGYMPHSFRSSGGSGIHLYLTWAEPQDAYSVREMLRAVLDRCGLKPGTGGVAKCEVEIFPKQNSVPADGFGSMFVLPFSGKSEPIGPFTSWQDSAGMPVLEQPPKPERTSTDLPELAHLKSALDAIPNNDNKELSYDEWRNIVFAIHYATDGSDAGLSLAHEFSARSSKYDGEFLDNRVWPYIQTQRGGAVVTERTIFTRAAAHGWVDPSILADFETVESLPAAEDGASADPTSQSAGAVKKNRFEFVQAAVFAAGTPLSWIVKGVLPKAELGVVYGESGSGKSFFIMDLMCAVARGVDWRGHKVTKGRVAYIAAEGASGARNRVKAYAMEHGVDMASIDLFILGKAPSFMLKEDIIELVNAIRAAGPFDLVVVDTLARVMPGANENASEDMGQALAHCKTIHQVTGATVVLIHHSGKDASKGARGHSSVKAAADVEIEIARCDDDRVATVTKMKDAEDGASFGFKLKTVDVDFDDDLEIITSCVVQHTDVIKKAKARKVDRGVWPPRIRRVLNEIYGESGGEWPTRNELSLAILDRHCLDKPVDGKRDQRPKSIDRAIEAMVQDGRLVMNGDKIQLPQDKDF